MTAGPVKEQGGAVTRDMVVERLKSVVDPELGIDIWTLGLVYEITLGDDGVDIIMTLTTPFCPFADELVEEVERAVGTLYEGDREGMVRVDITFDPPWAPSEELRRTLGI